MDAGSTLPLRTGNRMPVLGLGTWQLTHDTAETVGSALDLGYRMIDTASDYGTQPGIGEAIRATRLDRESIFLVAKVEETEDAYRATQANLAEMELDYADLILIHRPPAGGAGRELWEGLIRAKEDRLAKDIGVSNYATEQIRDLIEATGETPAVNQIEWSPFGHSTEMAAFCAEQRILIQAYSPLTRTHRLDDPMLSELAERYGRTPAQLLIRWNLQSGTVPLPKANRNDHLEENLGAFDFEISREDMTRLNEQNEHYSSLGALQYV